MANLVHLLHLSDLHRSPDQPFGNSEMLAALRSDRARWSTGQHDELDLILISGDVVQGVSLGAPDFEATLEAQYAEASEFLGALADTFSTGGGNDSSSCRETMMFHGTRPERPCRKSATAMSRDLAAEFRGQRLTQRRHTAGTGVLDSCTRLSTSLPMRAGAKRFTDSAQRFTLAVILTHLPLTATCSSLTTPNSISRLPD